MRRWILASAVSVGLLSVLGADRTAKADSFIGDSGAVFGTPTPAKIGGTDTVYSGVGTNKITSGAGGDPNTLEMDDPAGGFNTTSNTTFAVSNLTYYNGQTDTNTTPIDFPVTITLNFTTPSGLSQPFSFIYDLVVSPNNAQPISNPLNDDTLTVPVVYAPETFVDNGTTYTLEVLGFSSDGGNTITSQFVLPEDQTATSTLYATITAPPPSTTVPLPTAGYQGLACLGLLGLVHVARSRKVPQA